MQEIPGFLRAVWLDYTLYRVYGETQQPRSALLQTLNFSHMIEASPSVMRCLFVSGGLTALTPASLQDMMKIHYSPAGSNSRHDEETVILNWFNFLQECEGK